MAFLLRIARLMILVGLLTAGQTFYMIEAFAFRCQDNLPGRYANPEDPGSYIECRNDAPNTVTIIASCGTINGQKMSFGAETNSCGHSDRSLKNTVIPSTCSEAMGGARLPGPDADCSNYYVCEKGKGEIRTCPEGTLYNPAYRGCDNEFDQCRQ